MASDTALTAKQATSPICASVRAIGAATTGKSSASHRRVDRRTRFDVSLQSAIPAPSKLPGSTTNGMIQSTRWKPGLRESVATLLNTTQASIAARTTTIGTQRIMGMFFIFINCARCARNAASNTGYWLPLIAASQFLSLAFWLVKNNLGLCGQCYQLTRISSLWSWTHSASPPEGAAWQAEREGGDTKNVEANQPHEGKGANGVVNRRNRAVPLRSHFDAEGFDAHRCTTAPLAACLHRKLRCIGRRGLLLHFRDQSF